MSTNEDDQHGVATRSASPSSAEPASASAAHPSSRAFQRTSGSSQHRDPERYQIINEHGRGGLGRVSRAHDRDLGRDVAIKELISRGSLSEVRFLREALITARLEHPGIVPVHEAGRWPDGTPFYAMKLVAGRPLRDLIAERTTVTERISLLHHVIAVADAIAYAHDRNIIHRDLKPANVIVGDFGETIVIDWGLAKDLSTTEESTTTGGGPFRENNNADLTVTGSVLGTPAYMAPEQERGEHVDQRADVFAIGAMLWELCSLQKVPPTDHRLRHRLLRRAGIDGDLVAIIDKALDPDPALRYPDAGALASDIKAFKSGARIAARDYSIFAVMTHWLRQHRAWARTFLLVSVLGLAATFFYVRNIATERNRADTALSASAAMQIALSSQHADLTLKHAQLLMATDPTAALDSLSTYRGGETDRVNQLRAEAQGRCVARLRARPHTDSVIWLRGLQDGSVLALSVDGTITRTLPDGTFLVVATNVSPRGAFAYTPVRHLLAYACNATDICVMNIAHATQFVVRQRGDNVQPVDLAFSPNGTKLASISHAGTLNVLDVSLPDRPRNMESINTKDGGGVMFVDEDSIAVATRDGLKLVHRNGGMESLTDPDGTYWDAISEDHRLVLATSRGEAFVAETRRLRIASAATLCKGFISGLKAVPNRKLAVYACREGTVGTWDLRNGKITSTAHVEGHPDRIEVSASGESVMISTDNGVIAVVNLNNNLVAYLKGHIFRVTAMSSPTALFPYALSADVHGRIRSWKMPVSSARSVGVIAGRFYSAFYNGLTSEFVASTRGEELLAVSHKEGLRRLTPHTSDCPYVSLSPDGRWLAMYGNGNVVEIWSSSDLTRRHVFHSTYGAATTLTFLDNETNFVTADREGRLVRWNGSGEQRLIHEFSQPIVHSAVAVKTGRIVLGTEDGQLWRLDNEGNIEKLTKNLTKITRMLALPDGVSICIGYSSGQTVIIDTLSDKQRLLLDSSDAVRDIAITSDGKTLAIARNDNTVMIGSLSANALPSWRMLSFGARTMSFSKDGLLIAGGSDGAVWVYSLLLRTWVWLPVGTTDLTQLVLAPDANSAAAFDADGHIVELDLTEVRTSLFEQLAH